MKKLTTLILLALLPVLGLAQVSNAPATCMLRVSDAVGTAGWQVWGTWQCRPVAGSTQRFWDRFYAVADLRKLPAGAGAVYDKWKSGDGSAVADANKLRTLALNDAALADGYKAAQAVAAGQTPVATRADITTGKTCACDISRVDNGYLWICPLAPVAPSTVAGALVNCKPL